MQRGTRQDGLVLIVVVGVLAVMSLMALAFARYMVIERRAAENQAQADLAQKMARAGLDALVDVLREQILAYPSRVSEFDGDGVNATGYAGPPVSWFEMGRDGQNAFCAFDPADRPNTYGCRVLQREANQVGTVSFHVHDTNRGFYSGAGISDEDSKFNINAMGSLDDTGHERDYRIRHSAFDASLVRLIKLRLDAEDIAVNGTADGETRRRFAAFLARRIVRRRYGPDGVPGNVGAVERVLEQRPAFGQPFEAGTWTDSSLGFPFDGDGYPTLFLGQSANPPFFLDSSAEGDVWRSYGGADWGQDTGVRDPDNPARYFPSELNPLGAYSQVPSGYRAADGTLFLEENLVPYPPEGFKTDAEFVPDDVYNSDDNTGSPRNDDRVYRSVAEVSPVIREAIREMVALGWLTGLGGETLSLATPEAISAAAGAVFRALEGFLTVHSRAWVPNSVNINADWSSDGFDNIGDGLIDGPDELNWNAPGLTDEQRTQRLVALRRGLGLVERIPATGEYELAYQFSGYPADVQTQTRLANQLVVNIVDFMDGWTDEHPQMNNLPTRFLRNVNDDGDLPNSEAVYGAEGLHITEVMGTPDPLRGWGLGYTTGPEMPYWEWNPTSLPDPDGEFHGSWDGYHEVVGNVPGDVHDEAVARLDFSGGLKRGWYAFRVLAGKTSDANVDLKIGFGATQPDADSWWTVEVDSDAKWFYPRDGDGKLRTLEVTSANELSLWVMVDDLAYAPDPDSGITPERIRFYGIQLLPQFVSLTNIAKQSLFLADSHDIPLEDHVLRHYWISDSATTPPTYESGQIPLFSGGAVARFYDVATDTPLTETSAIPAARPDGFFPLNYGYLTVAVSERAYVKNFGNDETTNAEWGDHPDESYPVFFVGDALDDAAIGNFLIGRSGVFVELRTPDDELLAGGEVDFIPTDDHIPALDRYVPTGLDMPEYASMEKVGIVSPNDRTSPWWVECAFGYDPATLNPDADFLNATQNVLLTVPVDETRGIDGDYGIRSNLNSAYAPLWDAALGFPRFQTCDDLANANIVLPFILNRPYPNPAWMGLVPSGEPFRTIDPDPNPDTDPVGPHQMLGRLMKNAIVGGVHARINVNTAPPEVLAAVMDGDENSGSVEKVLAARPFATWDHFLNASEIWDNARDHDDVPNADSWVQFWSNPRSQQELAILGDPGPPLASHYRDDSGAGTYGDDFIDDSDEKEEWFRRFATVLDIRSHTFRTRVDGLVFERVEVGEEPRRPLVQARLEAVIDRSRDTTGDGRPNVRILEKRWVPAGGP